VPFSWSGAVLSNFFAIAKPSMYFSSVVAEITI